jgi:uncharacterized protein (TIGR00269 family)
MFCKLCKTNPVYKLPNGTLCKRCFIKYFENKVFKTIRKHNLFKLDDKIVVATSGGKDSITVLYLTHKYLKRKNLQKNISALAIDEGIKNYREHTLKFLKKFCKDLGVELNIHSYKELFGKTLDESISLVRKRGLNLSPCNVCGTFRRNALNVGARKLKATKVVTGHNVDDEAQSILLNIFKNNFKILSRLGPNNGVVLDGKFIPRVKPLYMMSEKEVRLYTILKGFDVGYDECPYAKGCFRSNIGEMINKLEDEHKGVKSSIVKFYLETRDSLKEKYIEENGSTVTYCSVCGEPSQRKVCNTCLMKELVNEE